MKIALAALVLAASVAWPGPAAEPGAAKPDAARPAPTPMVARLVHHGWDIPSPAYVRANAAAMERLPFDGTTIRIRYGEGRVFGRERWDEKTMEPEIRALEQTVWSRFTENYLMVYSASEMDWFDRDDWDRVIANIRLLARAARRGRLAGICFDPEAYGKSPWSFPEQARSDRKTFAEYQELVRRRGRDFYAAILKEHPSARLFTFFQLSIFFDAASRPEGPVPGCGPDLPERHAYGLLPAFLAGMLDACYGRGTIIDGNELAYYYTKPEDFYRAYHAIRHDARCMLGEDTPNYVEHVEVAQAIFVDEVLSLRGATRPAQHLSPAERLLWLEQNVYHALASGDGLAWIYSEQMDWWENRDVPPGSLAAIERARAKLARSQPLGFDLGEALRKARKAVGQ